MLNGVMLLWFVLTGLSLLFVAVDIRTAPESSVLKWGFVLVTAYTGVVGAFLYVLGCREPLPGLHERYVACAGGRRGDRPCTALPVMAWVFSRAGYFPASFVSPGRSRSWSSTFLASPLDNLPGSVHARYG